MKTLFFVLCLFLSVEGALSQETGKLYTTLSDLLNETSSSIIDNILTLMNVNPHATNIVKGAVILIAVLVDKKVKDLSAKAE